MAHSIRILQKINPNSINKLIEDQFKGFTISDHYHIKSEVILTRDIFSRTELGEIPLLSCEIDQANSSNFFIRNGSLQIPIGLSKEVIEKLANKNITTIKELMLDQKPKLEQGTNGDFYEIYTFIAMIEKELKK